MLEKGKQIGGYTLLKFLDSGGFGDVWKAEKRTAFSVTEYALKFFRPKDESELNFEKIRKEVEFSQKLSGLPYIISVIEADKFENYIYIVNEFADGGSLGKYLSKYGGKAQTQAEAIAITQDILKGLEQMHNQGIVHRDLKPDNILIKKRIYCLADFGISREMKSHSKGTAGTAGTFEYMPPEAFDTKPSITVHTDIWAVGVMLQKLLTGKLPFPQDNLASIYAAVTFGEPEEMPAEIPFGLREVVKTALRKKREDRYQTAGEMREALQKALSKREEPVFVKPILHTIDDEEFERQQETIGLERERTEREILAEKERQRLADEEKAHKQTQADLLQRARNANEKAARLGVEKLGLEYLNEQSVSRFEKYVAEKEAETKGQAEAEIAELEIKRRYRKGLAIVLSVIIGIIGLPVLVLIGVAIYRENTYTQPTTTMANKPAPTPKTANKAAPVSSNPNTFKNSIGMEFVKIPAGLFYMGSNDGETDEKPIHLVTISKEFYMGKYEVTQAEWKAVTGNNSSNFKGDRLPVENVSWEDAQDFIRKLNAKGEGKYRLPTEAEWEYACRGGSSTKYSYGDGEGSLGDYAWYSENAGGKTHEVGTKKANEFGLHDMHGNVWEWCNDWNGNYASGAVTDPSGPASSSSRVFRGGSWINIARNLRSAFRYGYTPSDRYYNLGFRLIRE